MSGSPYTITEDPDTGKFVVSRRTWNWWRGGRERRDVLKLAQFTRLETAQAYVEARNNEDAMAKAKWRKATEQII